MQDERGQGRRPDGRLRTGVRMPCLGVMASMLQPTAEVAADRQTLGRAGLLWRHKAAARVPSRADQSLSWHGAVAAELRREGIAVAATAQRGSRMLVDSSRDVRQTVAAGLPAPVLEAAVPLAVVTGLTAALFILLQLGSRLIRSRQRRRQVSI